MHRDDEKVRDLRRLLGDLDAEKAAITRRLEAIDKERAAVIDRLENAMTAADPESIARPAIGDQGCARHGKRVIVWHPGRGILCIACEFDAGRRAGAADMRERAVAAIAPEGERPCTCSGYDCSCGNPGDAEHVTSWLAARHAADAVAALPSNPRRAAMADRPIIFRPYQVRAALDGRLSQARVPITSVRTMALPDSRPYTMRGADLAKALDKASGFRPVHEDIWTWTASAFDYQAGDRTTWFAHLGYAVGQRLWVRENVEIQGAYTDGVRVIYDASRTRVGSEAIAIVPRPNGRHIPVLPGKIRPSINMPRWASRLTLVVTEVRVQRLQDISDEDAEAEGIYQDPARVHKDATWTYGGNAYFDRPSVAFWHLWTSLHGEGSWADNPWIVALTFTVHRCNIDAMDDAHAA